MRGWRSETDQVSSPSVELIRLVPKMGILRAFLAQSLSEQVYHMSAHSLRNVKIAEVSLESVVSEERKAQERQIINDCKAGKCEQFQSLISPYLHSIKLITYSILRNRSDMEEVTQESILKAMTHINQLRDGESFKAWLLQIAGNEARMRLRKDRKHLYSSVDEDINEKPFQPRQFVDWRDIPSQELERSELRKVLTAALECLEEGYREVFILRDVQHLSAAEAGRVLGITEGAVNTRLHRARLQMREQLTPFFRAPRPMSMTMPLKMMLLMGKTWMQKTISCRHVTRQLSAYIDGQLTPELREKIDEHLRLCDRCSIVLDTTRKLLYVAGDEKVFELPFESSADFTEVADQGNRPPQKPES
jgi:RNA polymerase sigma-70 factor, ECF subfamily